MKRETDLMPCPVCGSDTINLPDSHEGTVNCHGPTCCYGVWTEEEHNTLARRAEIGRLVESLIPENGRNLTIEQPDGQFGVFRTGKLGTGPTLLESLRALEKEVCGDT